ncbi:MAG: AAA family ATPase, partial [Candidatus Kapabacteria bacterium]|nr:AAA family ATPase [Candidatus Kapabacteria bacterium]
QGYLIVNALDLFPEAGVWQTMKRVLLYNKLEIQPYEAVFQLSQLLLKPEAIDLNVKIIIIGGQTLYRSLYLQEKGFKKMFKVNAQFDYESKRSDEMVMNYARYVSKICKDENFPHFKPSGVAAVAEWAVQHSGSQNKNTLKFSDVADIIRESVFYDPGQHGKFIRREDVEKAIQCRRHRNDLIDEKLSNNILDGTILIDITGERVGQINGLTILDDGILSFGKPARITALVSAGSDGIVNIEREVDMSGEIHSKAVMILSSIISEKFAKKKPLALNATIAFEQNYGGIDGDSATAAEIYVILSALADIPLKQSIAVTGSVNQPGDMQPIGGVNSKITGFYEICKTKGLTGKQGVIIPIQNVNDLMLPKQIVDSVKAKKFHIWPISRFEEGFKILTDIEAGERNEQGKYPEGTFFAVVEEKLAEIRKSKKKKKKKKKKK